jgi:GINS complex subunit 1
LQRDPAFLLGDAVDFTVRLLTSHKKMNYGRYGRELLLELKRGDDRLESAGTSLSDLGDAAAGAGGSSGGGGSAPLLAPYNDDTVANCLQDLRLHVQALHDQAAAAAQMSSSASAVKAIGGAPSSVSVSMQVRPNIVLQSAAIDRNKRCLLAYHVGRIERIKPYYWTSQWDAAAPSPESGPGATGEAAPATSRKRNTCPAEDDFLRDYASLVHQYTAALGLQPDDLRACGSAVPVAADKVLVRVVAPPPGSYSSGAGSDGDPPSRCRGIVLDSGASVVLAPGSTHYLLWDDVEEYVRLGYLQVLEGEEHLG